MLSLKAANGQGMLTSETYDTKKNAEKDIALVRKGATNMEGLEKKDAKKASCISC